MDRFRGFAAPAALLAAVAVSAGCLRQAARTMPAQPAIAAVIAPGARVELVGRGYQGLEGPVAAPDGGLYFTDIPARRIHRLSPAGEISVWREDTGGANGLFLLPDGRLLAAEGDGQRIVSIAPDRSVTALATSFEGRPLRRPNDLIPDLRGGIYFTDLAPRPSPDALPAERGNVLYLRPDGQLRLIDGEIARPNGITLSLDGRTLYVSDTEGEYVYAFDVQADGGATNKRRFARLISPEPGALGPRSRADGMAIDSEGRLYVSSAAGVQVVAPDGGHLGTILVPTVPRNVAFGGPQRRTLYMTAAGELYRVELLSQGPPGRAK